MITSNGTPPVPPGPSPDPPDQPMAEPGSASPRIRDGSRGLLASWSDESGDAKPRDLARWRSGIVVAVIAGWVAIGAFTIDAGYETPIPPSAAALYLAAGLIDGWRRPLNRIGRALVATGWVMLLGPLARSGIPVLAIPTIASANVVELLGAYVLLTFPTGHFTERVDRRVWTFAAAFVLADAAAIIVLADPALSAVPGGPVRLPVDQVGSPAYRLIFPITVVVATALSVAVGLLVIRRWLRGSGPTRRLLLPILVGGLLGVAAFGVGIGAVIVVGTDVARATTLIAARFLTVLLPAAILVAVLQLRIDRTAVVELVELLGRSPKARDVTELVRRILHDPSIEVLTWSDERGSWQDDAGRDVERRRFAGRSRTLVERNGRTVAAIIHDASLDGADALLGPVRAALALAVSQPAAGNAADGGRLHRGDILGPFRIEGQLGAGGMGVVYFARDLALDRPVALKTLAPEFSRDPRARRRFVREGRTAASLQHPAIVPVHAAGETDGVAWIAMGWIDGRDLESLLRSSGTLPVDRALQMITPIADALDHAAARGFVHRDVKPSNILVARSGQPYLADFGLTRALGQESAAMTVLTETGGFIGTLDYVAPEQIRGEEIGAAADIYSLACVLFTCLTGQPPFRRATPLATLWAHLHEPAPSILDYGLRAPLDAVIRRGLSKEPSDRFASAGAFAEAAQAATAAE